jgi:hypothetical protein
MGARKAKKIRKSQCWKGRSETTLPMDRSAMPGTPAPLCNAGGFAGEWFLRYARGSQLPK